MSISSITTSIFSKLGNNSSSVLPIAVKDTLSNAATTYIYDKKGGKHDGKEKAIEEFGTEILWIGGIPILKKLFDKTVYKIADVDPSVDIRKLKTNNPDNIKFTMSKLAQGSEQYNILDKTLKNASKAKGLYMAKFITATAATVLGLAGLIIYKQKTTDKEIRQDVFKKHVSKKALSNALISDETFKGMVINKKEKTSPLPFKGGIGEFMSGFMYNPVMNMSILDGFITGTRLKMGRKGERWEIGFNEMFQIAFIYLLAAPIQKGLEFIGKKLGRPIGIDFKMIHSEAFKDKNLSQALKDLLGGDLNKDTFKKFKEAKNDKEILNFIYDNPDNPIVKLLKASGDIPTVSKNNGKKLLGIIPFKEATEEIDSLAFIETSKIKKALCKTAEVVEHMLQTGIEPDKYLKQTKQLKAASIVANLLIGAAAIGIVRPLLSLKTRKERNNGDVTNAAIKNLEEEIEKKLA